MMRCADFDELIEDLKWLNCKQQASIKAIVKRHANNNRANCKSRKPILRLVNAPLFPDLNQSFSNNGEKFLPHAQE